MTEGNNRSIWVLVKKHKKTRQNISDGLSSRNVIEVFILLPLFWFHFCRFQSLFVADKSHFQGYLFSI